MPEFKNINLDISVAAIFKVLVAALGVYILLKIAPILILLFFAVLVAVAFEPVIEKMNQQMSRSTASFLIAAFMTTMIAIFLFVIVPPFLEQTNKVIERIPSFIKMVLSESHPKSLVHRVGRRVLGGDTFPDLSTSLSQIVVVGQLAIGTISSLGLFLAFTIYLMMDGPKIFQWFLPFFSAPQRSKVKETCGEVSSMISAYVLGQGIASLACGLYVFIVLTALQVPAALMLAVIAAVFAVLPIIGFYISLVPVVIFSLLVSPTTAALALLFYGLYHLFEGYFLIPLIYSKKLRLSGFVVLLAIVFGMTLMGVLGAIALLPLAASYPVIERIWLAKYLRPYVVETHENLSVPTEK